MKINTYPIVAIGTKVLLPCTVEATHIEKVCNKINSDISEKVLYDLRVTDNCIISNIDFNKLNEALHDIDTEDLLVELSNRFADGSTTKKEIENILNSIVKNPYDLPERSKDEIQ